MGTWKSVDVDVDIEVEDVIDFIENASDRELEEIKEVLREYELDSSTIHSSLYATQMYEDLMNAVHEAVARHVDMKMITKIISELK